MLIIYLYRFIKENVFTFHDIVNYELDKLLYFIRGRTKWRAEKCCKSKKIVLLHCACLLDKRCLTAPQGSVGGTGHRVRGGV